MAATTPATPTLRVRFGGPEAHHARAAWALEALLARARVLDWRFAEPDEAVDLDWGGTGSPTSVDLPADEDSWRFAWDDAPDRARDPLAFTFWWLARVEEQLAPDDAFDEHGRFRYARSAIARAGDPLAAPVDEFAAELAVRLARWVQPRAAGEPTWRLVLTHDIDLPWRWTNAGRRRAARGVRDALRGMRVGAAVRGLVALAGAGRGDDPWDNAAAIWALEESLGAQSTSYLLVARHVPEDGDEELHARGARWARDACDDRIGLHGSYTSSVVPGRLADERDALERRTGRVPLDHRFHYLRHRPIEAWPELDRLGFRSDASLGFAEQPGFRAGTAHPYRAWNHEAGRPLQLVVIPLAAMDASYEERYLDLRGDERALHVEDVVGRICGIEGSASLLVHNDRLCNANDDGWTDALRDILKSVRYSNGITCTAGAAADAYRSLLPAARLHA